MATNLELKCRCRSLEAAHAAARMLTSDYGEILTQSDTYFLVSNGRLKLRRIDGRTAELVQYDRPDASAARWSSYTRCEVSDPDLLERALSKALGIKGVVKKRRTVYLYETARIHLDEVEGLGNFLEFEIVETGEDKSRVLIEELKAAFSVAQSDILGGSYIDLLENRGERSEGRT